MKKGLKILKWVVLGAVFIAAFGWVTMSLWNWLVPALFNGPVLNFWQALGLLVLSKILFSGFGGKRHGHGRHWKHSYYEKLSRMTPEERAQFKEKMKERWCRKSTDASAGE